MNNTILSTLAMIGFLSLSSCQKETCIDNQRVVGNWIGKYSTVNGQTPNINFFAEIKSGGELIIHDGFTTPTAPDANKAVGTWTLNGNVFRATAKFLSLDLDRNYLGEVSTDNKKITGTRGSKQTTTGSGDFVLDKQ